MGKKIIKMYKNTLQNGDMIIVEVVFIGDPSYNDGIMYTFRCIDSDGNTRFAIENGHDAPHVHRGAKKELVDYDWKAAGAKFKQMLDAHMAIVSAGD